MRSGRSYHVKKAVSCAPERQCIAALRTAKSMPRSLNSLWRRGHLKSRHRSSRNSHRGNQSEHRRAVPIIQSPPWVTWPGDVAFNSPTSATGGGSRYAESRVGLHHRWHGRHLKITFGGSNPRRLWSEARIGSAIVNVLGSITR